MKINCFQCEIEFESDITPEQAARSVSFCSDECEEVNRDKRYAPPATCLGCGFDLLVDDRGEEHCDYCDDNEDYNDSMDDDHKSALESVYGPMDE